MTIKRVPVVPGVFAMLATSRASTLDVFSVLEAAKNNSMVEFYPQSPPPPWTGAGRPPVGTACEAEIYDGKGKLVWAEAMIIHHHPHHSKSAAIAHGGGQLLAWTSKFRPILTPEQIEAEERENAVQIALGDTRTLGISDTSKRILIERLYDAGYRKQPTDQ